jgi:outer membrane receptor protein involved in Fe transport
MPRFVPVALFLACVLATPAFPQSITASLEGVVHDSTGAVIPGAAVSVVNAATNAKYTLATGPAGRFLAPSLPPGSYVIVVEAAGFRRLERGGVELQVAQAARLDLTLEVGAVTDSIKVTGEPPLLEPATSSMGQVIETHSIVNLPLNQRNPFALIFLAPGVHGSVDRTFNSMNWSANGGRPGTNEILLDGVASSPPIVNPVQGFSIFPSVDAVQEFKMQTNNYSAEYGRSGGSIVNLIYKSGTNRLHGSMFEFLRNSKMDANEFFANSNNVPLKSFKRNQFGVSGGGPVVLPGIYNGRDRTFFYANYEGLRERSANSMLNATMPTELQRTGDFSRTLQAQGKPVTIYDPVTTALQGGKYIRLPFAGNVIPAGRIDSVSRNASKYFPLPNGPGDPLSGQRNYNVSGADTININQGDLKVDQTLSDRQRLFGRISRRKFPTDPAALFPPDLVVAQGGVTQNQDSMGGAVDYTLAATPTYLLNVRAGMSRMHLSFMPWSDGFDLDQLGFPAYMKANADRQVFPQFAPSGYRSIGNGGYDFRRNSFETWVLSVANTKVLSAHAVKFGFEGRMLRVHNTETYRPAGAFSFIRDFTAGPDATSFPNTAGESFASFLLGLGSGALTRGHKNLSTQSLYYGLYLADDWKLTPRLTINLGLRYDLELPRTERYDRMTVFDPAMPSPIAAEAGMPNLKGGLVYVGVNGQPRAQCAADHNNFAPRIGLAYQVSQRTAVRAAYGIFFAPSLMSASGEVGNYGYRSDTPYLGGMDDQPLFPNNYLRNPFPAGFVPAVGNSLGARTGLGDSIGGTIGNSLTPYTQNWNLSIQRELKGGVLVETSYVGMRGLKLNESSPNDYNLNQLRSEQLAAGATLQERVPNPFYGIISPVFSLGAPTIRKMDLIRAYPQYGTMYQMYRIGASSIYHSFQLKVERRFRGDLGFLMGYTNSKLIDDHSSIAIVGADMFHQNIYDRKAERSVSPNDVPQRLVFSYVWEFPFGRHKALGKSWNKAVDAVLGGWQTNGIMTLERGKPFTILANNSPNFGSSMLRANNNGKSAELSGPVTSRLNRYFDTSVFSQPAPYTFGNVGRMLPDVRSPGDKNFDLSLFKNFRIMESMSLQFRAEAFNAFNTPRFAQPIPGVTNPSFGMILGTSNTPRQLQFGLKILF